jgi:dethiobiotin synthetase
MNQHFIVTGTDTGAGKTVFSAGLAAALGASYWKPIQSGLEAGTDSETVRRLADLAPERILPEAYRFKLPASPHISAARESARIEPARLAIPDCPGPLVIEGAGGLLVPLAPNLLEIDVFASWGLPAILCATTALGTINHTLLSLEAMARRGVHAHGVAFIGEPAEEVEAAIVAFGGVQRLGRLPWLDPLNAQTLAEAFRANFQPSDFG